MIKTLYMKAVCNAGGAGASTGTDDSDNIANGVVLGVYLKFNGSGAAATLDTTIKTKGSGPPSYNLLVHANAAADGMFYPDAVTENQAGASIAASFQPAPVNDYLTLLVAQANSNDVIEAWVLVEVGEG